jgi:hypothetical protein
MRRYLFGSVFLYVLIDVLTQWLQEALHTGSSRFDGLDEDELIGMTN